MELVNGAEEDVDFDDEDVVFEEGDVDFDDEDVVFEETEAAD